MAQRAGVLGLPGRESRRFTSDLGPLAGLSDEELFGSVGSQQVAVGQASESDTALTVGRQKRLTVGLASTSDTALPVTVRLSQVRNTFEGLADETAPTTGNSGGASGVPFDAVSVGAGATLVGDTAQAAHGTTGLRVETGGTSTTAYVQYSTVLGTLSTIYGRTYLRMSANPASSVRVALVLGGGSNRAAVRITSAGKVQTADAAGTTVQTTTAAIALNQWVRVEWRMVLSATVGLIEAKLFNSADSSIPTETITSTATLNLGGDADAYRLGTTSNLANVAAFWLDDIGWSAAGYLGPAVAQTQVAVGQAGETTTAYPVGVLKSTLLGLPTVTDTALPVTAAKRVTVGVAVDTATALPVGVAKRVTVGVPSTTETTRPVGVVKRVGVGPAAEATTAATVGRVKTVVVGQAATSDTALPVVAVKRVTVGVAAETTTATAVTARKLVTVGQATETNTAHPVGQPARPIPAGRSTTTTTRPTAGHMTRQRTPATTTRRSEVTIR